MKKNIFYLSFIAILILFACNKTQKSKFPYDEVKELDTNSLTVKTSNFKNVKGQLLYLPIYSNIPFKIDTTKFEFDMSAFVAIHNTDLKNEIKVLKVLYFNTQGKMVYDFLKSETKTLKPLETVDFYVPHEDKSGTGANFLIEWISDDYVNEPLIESVTINLKTYHSAAIVSQGKIIREIK
jgi:hypothetical protein